MENTAIELDYARFIAEWLDSSDAITAHSSGSTGAPKAIRLPKSDMRRSARTSIAMFKLTRSSTIASALPMRSIATKMAVVRHLEAGCRYVHLPASNTFALPCHIDLLSIGPSQTDQFIGHPEYAALVGAMLVGGAPLDAARKSRLLELGYNLYESYGMTETCSNVALRRGADPHFTANPGISFSLDTRGCIVVHAPGYSFDGITTNDMAELLSDTTFIWRGRFDNVINSGGIKIFPEELEKELAAYISTPYYIIGVPDAKWGTAVLLVVEGDDAAAAEAAHVLSAYPDHIRRPKAVAAMAAFAHTPTGKIKRVVPESGLHFIKNV